MKAHLKVIEPVVVVEMTIYEAAELADYLDGTDTHLSIGDRMVYANQLRRAVQEE